MFLDVLVKRFYELVLQILMNHENGFGEQWLINYLGQIYSLKQKAKILKSIQNLSQGLNHVFN